MEQPEEQLRGGIFLPNLEKMSDQWRKLLVEQSSIWQEKFDQMHRSIEELKREIQSLQGVTVTIDRQP
jgi:DNA polymerase III delta prime subunit